MICVKLAVYLGYGVTIYMRLSEEARGLAPEALQEALHKGKRLDIPNISCSQVSSEKCLQQNLR